MHLEFCGTYAAVDLLSVGCAPHLTESSSSSSASSALSSPPPQQIPRVAFFVLEHVNAQSVVARGV
jgi:hypothetical protein